jgi:hypothetical protein
MIRAVKQTFLLAGVGIAAMLGGCSASVFDKLPAEVGGLPAGAPARPDKPYEYPAVHDMPPARAAEPMSQEEQAKVEKELTNVRDRQEGRPAQGKKAAPKVKKPQNATEGGQTTGVKPNP